MPPSTRIPPLLQPYTHLPRDDSLLLLTSTLGASANWLIIRFLCDALSNRQVEDGGDSEGHNVVLVSWMRGYETWKQEARKGAGLDLDRLKKEGRFAFVDGLSELCLDAIEEQSGEWPTTPQQVKSNTVGPSTAAPRLQAQRGPQALPVRGPPGRIVPARGPPPSAGPATTTASTPIPTENRRPVASGLYTLKSLDLAHSKTTITSAVSSLSATSTTATTQPRTLLILDNPDVLLALNPAITPSALTSLFLSSHNLPTVSHILTHIQADTPLLSLSTPPQPLELAHHNLLVKLGHMSRRILGLRVLDTGVARDVSGVVRVTEQKADWLGLGFEGVDEKTDTESGKGKEFLYQVKGDGSVRVLRDEEQSSAFLRVSSDRPNKISYNSQKNPS
jgi:elongator complex protein 6